MQIVKSSALLKKESELKKLHTKYKKTLTQVKRTRTMLKNTQTDIEQLQKNMGTGVLQNIYDIKKLQDEVLELLKKVQKSKKVSAEDRENARILYKDLSENELIPEEALPCTWEELEEKMKNRTAEFNTDEDDRQRAYAFFKQFTVTPDAEEKKSLRQIYIRLANRFHPDKAKNEAERTLYHDLMQQIITANESGDYAALQAIETEYMDSTQGIPTEAMEATVVLDALDEQMAKVRHQTLQLTKQLQRLKQELNDLKDSELGQMWQQEKQMQRYGAGMSTEKMAAEANEMRQNLTTIRDGMKELLATGKLPPEVLEVLQPQSDMPEDIFAMFNDFADDDDDDDSEGQYEYDENNGRFYTPDHSKANLQEMNAAMEDNFMGNPFADIGLPPDLQKLTDKIKSGELSEEEAQAEAIKMLKNMFRG